MVVFHDFQLPYSIHQLMSADRNLFIQYPLLLPCLSLIGGMAACLVMPSAFMTITVVTIALLVTMFLVSSFFFGYLHRQMAYSVALILLFAFAGYCRMSVSWHDIHREVGQERQTLSAVVIGEVSHYDGKSRMEAVVVNGPLRGEHIQLWVYGYEGSDFSDSRAFYVGSDMVSSYPLLSNGTPITFRAKVRPSADGSEYSSYLMSHGIRAVCSTNINNVSVCNIDKDMLSFADRLRISAFNLRQRLLNHLGQNGLTGEGGGIVTAMLLGHRSSLSAATMDNFRHSGASHVLALSGLHLGIIYMLMRLLTLSRRKRLFTEIITITLIWVYAIMVGMMPSVVRAAFMISICSLSTMCGRNDISVNTLALVAIVMTVINPLHIIDIGFQLSFISVAFILIYAVPMINCLCSNLSGRVIKWLVSVVVISIVAQMSTAPIVAHTFAIIPNYFLLTNLVVMPMAFLLLTLSLAMLLLSWVPLIGPFLSLSSQTVAEWFNAILAFISHLPGAVTVIPPFSSLSLLLFYVIIIAILEAVKILVKMGRMRCLY